MMKKFLLFCLRLNNKCCLPDGNYANGVVSSLFALSSKMDVAQNQKFFASYKHNRIVKKKPNSNTRCSTIPL